MSTICKELPPLNYQFQRLNPQSVISIDREIYSNVSYLDTDNEMLLAIILDDTDRPRKTG